MNFKTVKENYVPAVRQKKEKLLAEAATLAAGQRQDEANHAKICANVCDIFLTLFEADEKLCTKQATTGSDFDAAFDAAFAAAFAAAYRRRFEQMRTPWFQHQQAAETHGDEKGAFVEKIKLETLEQLRTLFEQAVQAEG